jgi:hypothetical protein
VVWRSPQKHSKALSFHENALLLFSKKDMELASGLLHRPYVMNNEVLKKEVFFNFGYVNAIL